MADFVTGTPSVVGFTNGNDYPHGFGYGISDKDQQFAANIDAGERTRDVMSAIYASIVATEKTGAASVLEAAKNGAALHVQIANNAAAAAAQAAANQQAAMMYANTNASTLAAQIAECCCETKELIRSIDAQRIRDELALLQTQFMMVTGGLTPAGVAASRGNNS